MAKTNSKRKVQIPDYRAKWAPSLASINARIAAGEVIMVTNAFGSFRLRAVTWSDVTGCMYHTGRDFSAASFCADLSWIERIAAGGA